MPLTLRETKGSELTIAELDGNFTHIIDYLKSEIKKVYRYGRLQQYFLDQGNGYDMSYEYADEIVSNTLQLGTHNVRYGSPMYDLTNTIDKSKVYFFNSALNFSVYRSDGTYNGTGQSIYFSHLADGFIQAYEFSNGDITYTLSEVVRNGSENAPFFVDASGTFTLNSPNNEVFVLKSSPLMSYNISGQGVTAQYFEFHEIDIATGSKSIEIGVNSHDIILRIVFPQVVSSFTIELS